MFRFKILPQKRDPAIAQEMPGGKNSPAKAGSRHCTGNAWREKFQIPIQDSKALGFIFLFCILIFAFLVSWAQAQEEGVAKMKKVVMIIAQDGFRDEELAQPKEILEQNGIAVKVASTTLGQARGMLGAKVKPDILVSDINVEDFDAIIFVGGAGASEYWDDPVAQKLAQDAIIQNRIVAAICIAPVTLAKAGILKGKRATVWSSEAGQLKANGANYTGKPVERDEKIITAAGPSNAQEFGEEIAKALK